MSPILEILAYRLTRALLGLFVAMCLPNCMSLVTASFPPGNRRNIAFAATGMGQPLGYALGLVLGGVLTDTLGWRWGFYITAIIDAVLFVASIYVIPSDNDAKRASWYRCVSFPHCTAEASRCTDVQTGLCI